MVLITKLSLGIYHLALEGTVLKSIELTEQFAPDLLEKNKDLHFDLLTLHFVRFVCSRKCTEALEFAQVKLAPFRKVQKYVKKLEFGSAQFDLCSLEGEIYAPSELCMSTLPLFHCSYKGEIEGCSSIPAIHYLCGSVMTYGEF
ncbi:putative glucose-induced degradation protein 8 -like protein isoform X2 [Capsicum annuum]|nr:putative glucose-induced degradation protein 8 -like protein isoform X2 [Capsicum annuum]